MKPAASLTGSLLVRKGAAAPSGMALRATQTVPTGWDRQTAESARTAETPWRKPVKSAAAERAPLRGEPVAPVAKTVRTTLPASCGPRADGPAGRRGDASGARSGVAPARGASAGGTSKATSARGHNGHGRRKLSLRLDPDRYLRLKLVAAHTQRSAQQLLTDLLDHYFEEAGHLVRSGCCQCLGDAAGAEAPLIDMRSSAIGRQRNASRTRS